MEYEVIVNDVVNRQTKRISVPIGATVGVVIRLASKAFKEYFDSMDMGTVLTLPPSNKFAMYFEPGMTYRVFRTLALIALPDESVSDLRALDSELPSADSKEMDAILASGHDEVPILNRPGEGIA
jgi:xanthine/uracil permease